MSKQDLRAFVKQKDANLATRLDHIWSVTKPLQEASSVVTKHGLIHPRVVENNVWRLLCESSDIHRKFSTYDFFVLSAAVCCHDIGMVTSSNSHALPSSFKHSTGTPEFIEMNYRSLGLTKHQARDIASILSTHDMAGVKFLEKLNGLPSDFPLDDGVFFRPRLLTVVLKTADLLHVDSSRIGPILTEPEGLSEIARTKYLAFESIRGWTINGRRFDIFAQPDSEEKEKAVQTVIEYIKNTEWPVIAKYLKSYGLPYELGVHIDRKRTASERMLSIRARFTSPECDEDKAVDLLLCFIHALNAYHIACGGNGLILDDWHVSVPMTSPVED
jgi:hypothetical protein